MAVNLVTINGALKNLIGVTPGDGKLWFVSSRVDWDTVGNVFSPEYKSVTADPDDGTFSVELQSTDDFEIGATYSAVLKYTDPVIGEKKTYTVGTFAAPSGGPYDITDLLAVPVAEPVPADVLALCLAAQAAAEAAADIVQAFGAEDYGLITDPVGLSADYGLIAA